MTLLRTPLLCLSAMAIGLATAQDVREYKCGIVWPEPVIVTPGKDNAPPSDAVVLFDGKDLSKWTNGENWVVKDGYATAAKSGHHDEGFVRRLPAPPRVRVTRRRSREAARAAATAAST